MEPYLIPNGKPPIKTEIYSETDILKWSEEKKVDYGKLFECLPQRSREVCFICRRAAYSAGGKDEGLLMGYPIRLVPTNITEGERKRQSEEAKAYNERMKEESASEVKAGVVKQQEQVKEALQYNPFKACSKPSDDVKPFNLGERVRLRAEMLPPGVFMCRACRSCGESGGFVSNTKIEILPVTQRNGINKYTQAGYRVALYTDEQGKKHDITDRCTITTGIADFNSNILRNLFQQMELIIGWQIDTLFEMHTKLEAINSSYYHRSLPDSIKFRDSFYKKLAQAIVRSYPSLLRSSTSSMMKTDGSVEIQDFSDAFVRFMHIAYNPLKIFQKYPEVENIIREEVFLWNANPFNRGADSMFDNVLDPLFAAALVGIPYSHIHSSMAMRLFVYLLNNFPLTDEALQNKDKTTYLRQLFNEGRNRILIHTFLYCRSFTSIFYSVPTRSDLLKQIDSYGGYLPWDKCLEVWKDMQHCLHQVQSIEPKVLDEKTRTAGFWLHMGMETNSQLDDRQIRENIYRFLIYLRNNHKFWQDRELTPEIEEAIRKTKIDMLLKGMKTVVSKESELKNVFEERKRLLIEKHSGFPTPNAELGHPKLSFKYCAYPQCGRQFASGEELKKHLIDASVDVSTRYHSLHAQYLQRTNPSFTPMHVMENKVTKCPVMYCRDHDRIFTPEELCRHFAIIGLEPFWTPDMDLSEKKDVIPDEKKDAKEINPWLNPGACSVCIDADCDTVLIPCGHVCICSGCLKGLHICPICRTDIAGSIALQMARENKERDVNDIKVFFAGL